MRGRRGPSWYPPKFTNVRKGLAYDSRSSGLPLKQRTGRSCFGTDISVVQGIGVSWCLIPLPHHIMLHTSTEAPFQVSVVFNLSWTPASDRAIANRESNPLPVVQNSFLSTEPLEDLLLKPIRYFPPAQGAYHTRPHSARRSTWRASSFRQVE